MRTQLRALAFRKRLFQQRQLVVGDLDAFRIVEKSTIELAYLGLDQRRELYAPIHLAEKLVGRYVEELGVALVLLDNLKKTALRQKPDVLRKHRKDAAHEELRDLE